METDQADSSFEHMYQRYSAAVLAYCIRRIGHTLAVDACSETFLAAWRRFDQVPAEPKTLPYLYGVAARVLSNQPRSLVRRKRLDSKLAHVGIAPVPDPAIVVAHKAENAEVVDSVRRLGPIDREIMMLYTWEGLSRSTIAEIMDMKKTAVDQRIHRSYKRLARVLRHTITNNATIGDEAQGVLFAHGGTAGGHALYIQDGHLHYMYNWLAEEHQKITSDRPVESGRHLFVAEFKKTGDDPETGSALGTLTLYIDTEPVGKSEIRTQPGNFPLTGDGLCVGRDSASPVSPDYKAPFGFTGGEIDRVVVDVGGDAYVDHEKEAVAWLLRD